MCGEGGGQNSKLIRLLPNVIFESENRTVNLAQKSIRGGVATLTSQGIQLILTVVGTSVLARLLTPTDYGLIGMVIVVVGFADMFKDAGLSMATIQRQTISHKQISTLFWFNLLISAFIGLCILALSPLVAKFYGHLELTAVTAVLSLSFIAGGLSIQHQALLRRHMSFTALAIVQIVAQLVGLVVSLLCAFHDLRYWSLVIGTLVRGFVTTLLTFYFCPWVPGAPEKDTAVFDMLRFGSHLTGFNFVNYFARNADNILIGKFIGVNALGLYSRAYQLFLMPLNQIRAPLNQVTMPVLSALHDQPERYAQYYTRMIDVLASIAMPLTIYCAIEADFLIRVFLGSQWLGAVPVFRILAIAGLLQTVTSTSGMVLVTSGFSSRYFWYGTISAIITVISFTVGLPFGIEGVAAAYTIVNYVVLIPSLFFCFHRTPVTVGLFMKTMLRPLVITSIATTGILSLKLLWIDDSLVAHCLYAISFFSIYVGLFICQQSVREQARFFVKELFTI